MSVTSRPPVAPLRPVAPRLSAFAIAYAVGIAVALMLGTASAVLFEHASAGPTSTGAAMLPAAGRAQLADGATALAVAALVVLAGLSLAVVRPVLRLASRLNREVVELTDRITIDPLTGTLNGRGFQERGTVEIHKARRYNRPLALLMIDPDQFEPINRQHGSDAGDRVLRALTQTLADGTRLTDLVGRVGGEFAVLLPETDLAGAQLLAERLRRRISDLVVPVADAAVSCTVSIGVTAAEKDAAFFWPTFQRAGEALYEAKMRGRNRVFVHAA